jgi:hypothetical protein
MCRRVFVRLWALLLLTPFFAPAAEAGRVDFNHQIRPLLSDRCFTCHGPDENARKAKLRLDLPPPAGSKLIVPGKSSESELLRRITASDPDDLMPPPDSKLSLKPDEIALIRRWIDQGAEYMAHWAFIPLQKTSPPEIEDPDGFVRNPVDAFVLKRLLREKLKPSPEASRSTLIRRLSFDLRGLPPSPEEVSEFIADASPDAYEKLVGRFLDSPAYGEQMATAWLDLARYADTYGYQNDVERDMSAWRDWVIHAFNRNLPYNEFLTEQLAGDLLPEATRDQILATAFNRLHRQTNEGGSIEEEWRTEYVADRVNTMGTAFLGLSLECARCHDHKYDPITQKDYYRLFAFFNNIDESGLYAHFTRATPSPALLLYGEGAEEKHRFLKNQIAEAEAALALIEKEAGARFEKWIESGPPEIALPDPVSAYSFDEIEKNTTPNSVQPEKPAQLADAPEWVDGREGKALRFNGENSVACKEAGQFGRTDPFTIGFWLKRPDDAERVVVLHYSRSWTDSASRGYELLLEHGRPAFNLVHFWPGNAIGVRANDALPLNAWTHVTLTYDGSSRADGMRIFVNGKPAETEVVRDHLYKDIHHRKEWGDSDAGKIELTLAARFRDVGFKNGEIDELKIFNDALSPGEVRLLAGTAPEQPSREILLAYYLHRMDADYAAARTGLKRLRDEENSFVDDIPEIMVMREMAEKRPTHVLARGAYDAPGEPVEPSTPESIMPFAEELPRNRLGLAQWMTDPKNPLTARVAVNRIWQMHFGGGLVPTVEDFGNQGELPAHPELLDWLAGTFIESGWDVKALHRLIVSSATYRQSSAASAVLVAADPDNRLLARGPKHRLPAELIRDQALAASGLLTPAIGGPSVKPYQPAGLWEESGTGKTYRQDKGEKLYRRSLYTFWRRTAPPPSMLVFDAVSREVCTAQRQVTSTPLQSLVLLNDPQFVEAARVLAEKLVRQHESDVGGRIDRAFELLASRKPQNAERDILRRLYAEQLDYFKSHPGAAEKLLATGEHSRDENLPAEDVAATALIASALMNYDEFVMKR